ncbi:hypothetical protein C8F04DRAFT_1313811 [Mycena alexandri]|uniref:Uncharacterized protein n=1 Tax=Mycena alexandri TaxID=1745969 RepID=A0AAD6S5F0_9AGAR|nr:hypothetical protein C8F04DRAFT_1313811 [Mycena alexandri]
MPNNAKPSTPPSPHHVALPKLPRPAHPSPSSTAPTHCILALPQHPATLRASESGHPPPRRPTPPFDSPCALSRPPPPQPLISVYAGGIRTPCTLPASALTCTSRHAATIASRTLHAPAVSPLRPLAPPSTPAASKILDRRKDLVRASVDASQPRSLPSPPSFVPSTTLPSPPPPPFLFVSSSTKRCVTAILSPSLRVLLPQSGMVHGVSFDTTSPARLYMHAARSRAGFPLPTHTHLAHTTLPLL